jgi:hypothetical protein
MSGTESNLYANSDQAVTDGSFVRLKNLALSYTIKSTMMEKFHLQNARIFIQGQNLMTMTKYKNGLDPETLNSGGLPPLRTITTGVHITF